MPVRTWHRHGHRVLIQRHGVDQGKSLSAEVLADRRHGFVKSRSAAFKRNQPDDFAIAATLQLAVVVAQAIHTLVVQSA